ncbi:MAG: GAF domain-containing protein [Myxococcales bacterium]|nr:GAF domain-containing protein [Myxococcales bacterium]
MNDVQAWLEAQLAAAGAVAGTVHRRAPDALYLTAAVAIPAPVRAVVARIPEGKGMAGLAWQRREPVIACNLQTDNTGDVRPGARAVEARAAVAIPVLTPAGVVRAVVGFAFADERAIEAPELAALAARAATLPVETE